VNDERPSDITAKRRCERWVMRAAELITGVYLDNKEEAEVALLLRLDEGSIEDPAAPLLGARRDTRLPEQCTRWSSHSTWQPETTSIGVARGGGRQRMLARPGNRCKLDLEYKHVDISVDLHSLACQGADPEG
jgi:hypothetical protein